MRRLFRKMTAKIAAKSISAPRIIWYTLAVTLSRPMFISTVAMRSKTVGMASRYVCAAGLDGSCNTAKGRWYCFKCHL